MPSPQPRKSVKSPVVASRVEKASARRRQTNHWLIVGGVLGCLALVIFIATWDIFGPPRPPEPNHTEALTAQRNRPSTNQRADAPADADQSLTANTLLVDDDGQTLWASPTDGQPLDLSYLPPGVQIIVGLRPEALAEHPEGEKVFAALGPLFERGAHFMNEALLNPQGVGACIVGCQATADGRWQTTFIASLTGSRTGAEHMAAELPNATKASHGRATYWLAEEWAYYLPPGDEQRIIVTAPESITEIIDLAGSPPPLRRDVERLLEQTDADRHLTVLVAPTVLFGEGRSMFSGPMARLRDPLFWFLGDELSAAALSLHWDESFFVELIAVPTLDTSPQSAAKILAGRLEQIPDRLEEYVVGLDAHPYGRRVVARFPGMVRKLATYVRGGFDSDHATLRAYLPAVAGHNLLMGAELTLAEAPAHVGAAAEAAAPSPNLAAAPESTHEALRRVTSLSFARDTLEAALKQLSQDIGVEIRIAGADLQADGITKNQSFGVDLRDQPAGEILVEILRLANPDKAAAGPSDPRQKLVYVIAPAAAGEPGRILVTTRSAAAERGDDLPPVFDSDRR